MLNDAARVVTDSNSAENADGGKLEHRELKTKDDIKNYIKGIL